MKSILFHIILIFNTANSFGLTSTEILANVCLTVVVTATRVSGATRSSVHLFPLQWIMLCWPKLFTAMSAT